MVKIRHINDLLAEAPLFEGMKPEQLEILAGCGKLAHFHKGEFLLKEGEAADRFFLIRNGEVAIESHLPGGVLTIAKADEERVVGYSWLFPPYRNQFDARATTDVDVIVLDGKCLRDKTHQDHELGYQFMKRFAALMLQRMQAARRQLLDIYGKPSEANP
ncbi:MAG: cyclic nucleotide-binding domain-containing protein [Bacteroidota bacterium]